MITKNTRPAKSWISLHSCRDNQIKSVSVRTPVPPLNPSPPVGSIHCVTAPKMIIGINDIRAGISMIAVIWTSLIRRRIWIYSI